MQVPPEFTENIAKALDRLYDLAFLETSPLTASMTETEGNLRSKLLRGELVNAIESLRPPESTLDQISLRPYRILEGRYIAGQSVEDLCGELSLSRSQYYREQARALRAIAAILWHKWELHGSPQVEGPTDSPDQVRDEVAAIARSGMARRLDVMAVVREALSVLKPLIDERAIRVVLSERTDASIVADPNILRQCLLVSLSDAIVRAGEGALRIYALQESSTTLLEIAIEAASARDSVASESRDTTQALVRALSGEVEYHDDASSQRMLLRFPSPNTSRTVLLVDNSRELAGLFGRYLDGQGWLLVHTETVEQAWSICVHSPPAVILLDLLLPDQDGWHLLAQLRQSPHTMGIPVIICSVLNQPELAMALGASGYLRKPVTQSDLLKTLARWR